MAEELWLSLAGEPARLVLREPRVARVIRGAYGALRNRRTRTSAWTVEVVRLPGGLFEVRHEPQGSVSRSETLWGAVTVVDHLLRERYLALVSPDRLVLHAAALARHGGRAALLLAPSGTGKSTLATALAAQGWTHLGDELVAVGRGARLVPFPRLPELEPAMARALARRWPSLEPLRERGLRSVFVEPPRGSLPRRAGRWSARAVVFVRRSSRAPSLAWEELAPTRATLSLIRASFNGRTLGAAALPIAADLSRIAPARSLVFRSAARDAEQISRELGRLVG